MNQFSTWFDRYNISLMTVLMTLVLLIGASVAIFLLKRLLQKWLTRSEARLRLPYETVLTITRVITGALWVMTVMLVLEIWGVGVGWLWTLLVSTVTVIGVGFLATWTMVSNITASFFIAVWRPFYLGDSIEVLPENLKGRVIDRNLMFVVLREENGCVIQIPNNLFFQRIFKVSGNREPSLFEAIESNARANRRDRPV